MSSGAHHVIIGSGSAGFGAALTLREGDADCRISLVTMDSLPFYNRFDLPQIFRGMTEWREMLAAPPAFYDENKITLRRHNRVVNVEGQTRCLRLSHQESVSFDTLLVCSGGRGYVPENLIDKLPLMHGFASFEAMMQLYRDLPKGGHAIMIGGDMVGIDLALTLVDTGYRVTLIETPQTFWPHEVVGDERRKLIEALANAGLEIAPPSRPVAVREGASNGARRAVRLADKSEIAGDVVIPSCGLLPSVEFMLNAGVDIERGILVNPELGSTNPAIWAAGDVCQIWHDREKAYKFYHGWGNVRRMGELAARNMLGAHEIFDVDVEDRIGVDASGNITSSFWTQ
ncbi:MAG: NAD(P)/FAD-dependent oxidoreductase [Paracoccaceae bacterium]